jgi:HK97 family phage prohead protease
MIGRIDPARRAHVHALARSLRSAPPVVHRRNFALDDITIRSDGTGRTVEAYAAVFGVDVTVSDFEGRGYIEAIRRGAFERTLAQRGGQLQVIYNHGLDIYGNPAAEYAKPLGVVVEAREDTRGLFTAVRYARTPLADEILELIREQAIRAMSVGGNWIRSTPAGPYRPGQRVERLEMALREFGPTPFPVYDAAEVVGIRSVATLADEIAALSPDERLELGRIISGTPTVDPADTGTIDDPAAPTPGSDPEQPPAAVTTPTDDTPTVDAELALLRARHVAGTSTHAGAN